VGKKALLYIHLAGEGIGYHRKNFFDAKGSWAGLSVEETNGKIFQSWLLQAAY